MLIGCVVTFIVVSALIAMNICKDAAIDRLTDALRSLQTVCDNLKRRNIDQMETIKELTAQIERARGIVYEEYVEGSEDWE